MALILNIDTATAVCSVSLSSNGKVLAVKESIEEKAHASMLTVFIERLFHETGISIKNLDAVSISKGPGSYTGLRIGVSTAKGICYANDIPLIGINTLLALANGAILSKMWDGKDEDVLFCPMIDARRMEVYCAVYDINKKEISETTASIIDENSFSHLLKSYKLFFSGSGAEKCKQIIKNKNAYFLDQLAQSSVYMISLSEEAFSNSYFENVAYFEPFYLKDFITTVPKTKLLGS